jgi:hypothetical protein
MLKKLALALALAGAPLAAAEAGTLTAGQAETTALADRYANIHYTVMEGTYQVVITVSPEPDEGGPPMRVVSELAEGESQGISIGGFGNDTLLTTLTVERTRNQVSFNVGTRNVSWRQKVTGNPAD